VIAHQVAQGIAMDRIVLAGFSQGGVMALHIGTRTAEALAGVVALSCFLARTEGFDRVVTEAARATPVFMGHGTMDTIIPFAQGEQAREALGAAGVTVEWHRYGMAHGVSAEEIEHIGQFIRRVLALGQG
jgi:phospholipase/carboxylesterase